ncbi:MAG: hypothetical protein WC420_00055 [Candidatus Paceibacterota bacterium]|jgi:hypothetical protein
MGFLSSLGNMLSGRIYHFNSINAPIDNSIAAKIKRLDDAPERFLLIMSFGITQEMVGQVFHPDSGIFKKSLESLTAESLTKIYFILLDLSVSSIIKLPLNINERNIISGLSRVSDRAVNKTAENIKNYTEADSGIMKAYENICSALNKEQNKQTAILFGTTFMKIYNEIIEKIGSAVYEN